jgi:heat shock protein HtpX
MYAYRTIAFFTLLIFIFLCIGFLFSVNIILAFVLSLIISGLIHKFSGNVMLKILDAEPLDDKKIENIVDKLSKEAKIRRPKIYITDFDIPNALSLRGLDNYVVITQGIKMMGKDEIKAIISHEIAHIKFNDTSLLTAVAFTSLISFPVQYAYSTERKYIFWPVFILFLPLVLISSFLIKISVSSFMNYRADYTGSLITKNPKELASALKKINEVVEHNPMNWSFISTSMLWTLNPFKKDWFVKMLSSDPPIERRIERLEEMSGL